MSARLIIVNNGLKDLRGHYFETSVSVAEAARQCDLQPVLAAHATCSPELFPPWLDCYPICTTDHWMNDYPPPVPDLQGIRCDLAHLPGVPIDAVLEGRASLGDYLRSRFHEVPFPEAPPESPQPRKWKRLVKAALKEAFPPFLLSWLADSYRPHGSPAAFVKHCVRAAVPPLFFKLARLGYRRARGIKDVEVAPPQIVEPAPAPSPFPPGTDPLQAALLEDRLYGEYESLLLFQTDLERLLCLVGVQPGDHVFFPTAHGRELLAIQRLLARLPRSATPTFHLEFRHTFELEPPPGSTVHPYARAHRIYFDHYRRQTPHPSVHLYTDTSELSDEYRELSGLEWDTLPIPFKTTYLRRSGKADGTGPVTIAFTGDVRDEKGFYWLPELVEAMEDRLAAGKVRFLIQATLGHPGWNPKSRMALERLKGLAGRHVVLLGLEGPLSRDEYYKLVSKADLLLCPYEVEHYVRRSSGTLTEAVAAGTPTVVQAGTWLARQQPPGAGETCSDLPSFIQAVCRICDDYPSYQKAARAAMDRWLAFHTPGNLVRHLLRASEGTGRQVA